jgi:hypothetical protein
LPPCRHAPSLPIGGADICCPQPMVATIVPLNMALPPAALTDVNYAGEVASHFLGADCLSDLV